jgi:hypothetical protein
MKPLQKAVAAALLLMSSLAAHAQMSKVQTVWIILMENHNWTGNSALSPSAVSNNSDPDLKRNPLAPFINTQLIQTSAHAEQYFNPPGNHPSQPNYWWLEAGTNFGVLEDTQPGDPQIYSQAHLVRLLERTPGSPGRLMPNRTTAAIHSTTARWTSVRLTSSTFRSSTSMTSTTG